MGIVYHTAQPPRAALFALFESTGWNESCCLSPEELDEAVGASWHMVAAYDGAELVGFGRVISDGVFHALIVELIILPTHQGMGIGRTILDQLVERCRAARIRTVQLFCARGKRGFYEKLGFRARAVDAPGMELIQ